MIPKVIHYVWFGSAEMPEYAVKCIASWKKFCPEYEIKEWNENNFDIEKISFCKQAYENGKFAFVSDYVRLWVISHHGGIYLDTDVELIKSLNDFISDEAFVGRQRPDLKVQTAVMGCESGYLPFIELTRFYERLNFIVDGKADLTPNVELMTNYFKNEGLVLEDTFQKILGLSIYPTEFLCPLDWECGILRTGPNTYAIHHFEGSWSGNRRISRTLAPIIGVRNTAILKKIYKKSMQMLRCNK